MSHLNAKQLYDVATDKNEEPLDDELHDMGAYALVAREILKGRGYTEVEIDDEFDKRTIEPKELRAYILRFTA